MRRFSEMIRLKTSIAELRKVIDQADDDLIDQDYHEDEVQHGPELPGRYGLGTTAA